MPVLAQLISARVISEEPRTADFFRVVIKLGIYAVLISTQQHLLQILKLFLLLPNIMLIPFKSVNYHSV
jgi:hypothetical protein